MDTKKRKTEETVLILEQCKLAEGAIARPGDCGKMPIEVAQDVVSSGRGMVFDEKDEDHVKRRKELVAARKAAERAAKEAADPSPPPADPGTGGKSPNPPA